MRDMALTYVHVWLWWLLLTRLLPGHLLVLSVALEAMIVVLSGPDSRTTGSVHPLSIWSKW